jgi:hypothetical protein
MVAKTSQIIEHEGRWDLRTELDPEPERWTTLYILKSICEALFVFILIIVMSVLIADGIYDRFIDYKGI